MSTNSTFSVTTENFKVLASPEVANGITDGTIKKLANIGRKGLVGAAIHGLDVAINSPIVPNQVRLPIESIKEISGHIERAQRGPVKRQLRRFAIDIIEFDKEVRSRGVRLEAIRALTETVEELDRRLKEAKKLGLSVSPKDQYRTVFDNFYHNLVDIHRQLKERANIRNGHALEVPELESPLEDGSRSKKFRSLVAVTGQVLRQIETMTQPATSSV